MSASALTGTDAPDRAAAPPLAGSAAFGAATVSVGGGISAALAVAAVFAAVAVSTGQTAVTTPLAGSAAFPPGTPNAGAGAGPLALAGSVAFPAAGVRCDAVITPTPLAGGVSFPSPGFRADARLTAPAFPAPAGFPQPATRTGYTGTAPWAAAPAPPRWQARPSPGRWQAAPAPPRWQAVHAAPRWAACHAPARWRIMMASFAPVSAAGTSYVNVTWTSELDGTSVDPTGQTAGQPILPVQMAFPVSSGNPAAPAQAVTWYTAGWLLGGTGFGYVAQCLVGSGGVVTLTAGQSYDVWSRITGTPEVPEIFAGTQSAY